MAQILEKQQQTEFQQAISRLARIAPRWAALLAEQETEYKKYDWTELYPKLYSTYHNYKDKLHIGLPDRCIVGEAWKYNIQNSCDQCDVFSGGFVKSVYRSGQIISDINSFCDHVESVHPELIKV